LATFLFSSECSKVCVVASFTALSSESVVPSYQHQNGKYADSGLEKLKMLQCCHGSAIRNRGILYPQAANGKQSRKTTKRENWCG